MDQAIAIEPAVISAPFGNYIAFSGTTPTLGTFTAHRRRGRVWRVLRTVRYSRRMGAWVNRIGLRNPGIGWLEERVRRRKVPIHERVVSLHGFVDDEWWTLLQKAGTLRPLAIELNMSCPNVGEVNWPGKLFERAMMLATPIIVKLPPVRFERLAVEALAAGVRWFHCCNTLPVPGGGMSGKPLLPLSLRCIEDLRALAHNASCHDELRIIGGGGITTPSDVDAYADAGAHRFALGSALMHPRYLFGEGRMRSVIDRARERAA